MAKKITAVFLCLIMLTAVLIGCGEEEKSTKKSSKKSTSSTETTAETKEEDSLYTDDEQAAIDKLVNDRISELKTDNNGYGGATFQIVGRASSAFPTEEEITGDQESDCVYERNSKVAEDFDIVYDYVITETGVVAGERVIQDRDSGLNEVSLAFGSLLTAGNPLFSGGYLTQISDYDQIDITNPWWLGTMEKFYALDGKLMFLSGDILPGFFDNAACILYNKTVAENYGIDDDFYGYVKDGVWTIDKMFEVASVIPGGSDIKRYGDATYDAGLEIMVGCGETITKFDAEGNLYIDETLPAKIDEIAAKFNAETGDSNFCYNAMAESGDDIETGDVVEFFVDNKILYMFTNSCEIATLREDDVDGFGILPLPKYDEAQENYITYSSTGGEGSIYLPRNPKDADMTGTIVEAMGAYSYNMIRPVYYDMRLKTQSVYDLASRDMLDLIYETQVYDLFELYGDGSFEMVGKMHTVLTEGIFADNSTIVSDYKSQVKSVQLMIKTCMKTVNKYYND